MSSIKESVRYPTGREDWFLTVLIGGVLSLFGFLFLPLLFVFGYAVRVVRSTAEGRQDPPLFDGWIRLLGDGTKVVVIAFVYMLVPLAVGNVTIGGAVTAVLTGDPPGAAAGIATLVAGALVTFVVSLAFGYAAVAAVAHFAHEKAFVAAFAFGTVLEVMSDREYALAWLLSVVVLVVTGVVVGLLGAIPGFGAFFGSFVFFYALIVVANIWGGGYAAAREEIGGAADRGDAVA